MASVTTERPFVPEDFAVPRGLDRAGFRLVPLTPAKNTDDYSAWQSSQDHIRRTPGFEAYGWPVDMTLEQNRRDLENHEKDFEGRRGFTYSVLTHGEVVGCVYIYPSVSGHGADVRSWVRADRADLDQRLYETVSRWLRESWPFEDVWYSPRPIAGTRGTA